jgi:hypothetical protein
MNHPPPCQERRAAIHTGQTTSHPLAKRDCGCFKSSRKKRQANDAGVGRLGFDIFLLGLARCLMRRACCLMAANALGVPITPRHLCLTVYKRCTNNLNRWYPLQSAATPD